MNGGVNGGVNGTRGAGAPCRPDGLTHGCAGTAYGCGGTANGRAGIQPLAPVDAHLAGLAAALLPYRAVAERLGRWGAELAATLGLGGRLLVAGNGGSAAEAQHLAAELVGKLRDDRRPLSAIALSAETSSLTAISNDYGYDEVFARQVRAHGRPGDILLLLSTSGRSPNLLAAADAGRDAGLRCWAFTGPLSNPLADACADVLAVPSPDPQVVQELHLVSAHVLCEYVEQALPAILGGDTSTHHTAGCDGDTAGVPVLTPYRFNGSAVAP